MPYYLFCRALELSLKAFLLTKGESMDTLRKHCGHDLAALWRRAEECGILDVIGSLAPNFEGDLAGANNYYKGKAFEYFDFSRWAHSYEDLPPFERFRDEANDVVVQTTKYCFAVS